MFAHLCSCQGFQGQQSRCWSGSSGFRASASGTSAWILIMMIIVMMVMMVVIMMMVMVMIMMRMVMVMVKKTRVGEARQDQRFHGQAPSPLLSTVSWFQHYNVGFERRFWRAWLLRRRRILLYSSEDRFVIFQFWKLFLLTLLPWIQNTIFKITNM